MARPSPACPPDDLFDAIATLLEPGQRAHFYQRMLYFKHLGPDDELLRLVEAIGLLALLIREAPHAVARVRAEMAQLLDTSLATIRAGGEAGQAYLQQLDGRLTELPTDLAQGINPEAIARAMTESLRQQFVQSGVPATADALTALAQQLTHVTGQLHHAVGQLSACTGVAEQARRAIDHVSTSAATATDTARRTVAELTHQVRVEGKRAVCLLCGAAWLLGVLAGLVFDRWRGVGVAVVPPAIAVPAPLAAPSSAAESTPKKPMRDTPRPRRDSHVPTGPTSERPRGTVMEQWWHSAGHARR